MPEETTEVTETSTTETHVEQPPAKEVTTTETSRREEAPAKE